MKVRIIFKLFIVTLKLSTDRVAVGRPEIDVNRPRYTYRLSPKMFADGQASVLDNEGILPSVAARLQGQPNSKRFSPFRLPYYYN